MAISLRAVLQVGQENRYINIPVRTESVGFTGQPFCEKHNTGRVAGIKFTGGEHQLKLFHQHRKRLIEMA